MTWPKTDPCEEIPSKRWHVPYYNSKLTPKVVVHSDVMNMSILYIKVYVRWIVPNNRKIIDLKLDTDLTTMINGIFYIPILCFSPVLIIIIVQHVVFFLHLSFRFSRGSFTMYNGISRTEMLLFNGNLREKKGWQVITIIHKDSRRSYVISHY